MRVPSLAASLRPPAAAVVGAGRKGQSADTLAIGRRLEAADFDREMAHADAMRSTPDYRREHLATKAGLIWRTVGVQITVDSANAILNRT